MTDKKQTDEKTSEKGETKTLAEALEVPKLAQEPCGIEGCVCMKRQDVESDGNGGNDWSRD
jgi:hypothetical protein